MKVLGKKEITEITEVMVQVKQMQEEYQAKLDHVKALRVEEKVDVDVLEQNVARAQQLLAEVNVSMAEERRLVNEMAARIGLDLDRPVEDQIRELMMVIDGSRRLSGTLGSQRKVGGHRKAARRRKR